MPVIFEARRFAESIANEKTLLFLLTMTMLTMAFSRETRDIILERDGYMSVESGDTNHLEAAHYNHDKKNPLYDHPSSGRTLTRREHYLDHYKRHADGTLGLTRFQNRWALNSIWRRMTKEERKGLPEPPPLNGDAGVQLMLDLNEEVAVR